MGNRSRGALGLAIGIGALALCVAWFAWSGGRAAVEPAAHAAERADRPATALEDPSRARDAATEARALSPTARELAADATPSAPPLAFDPTREFLVRVVRASDERPLAGATVREWLSSQREWSEFWYEYAALPDVYEREKAIAREHQCDAWGRLVLERRLDGQRLAARTDGWFGLGRTPDDGERECVIRCEPDRALDVRVVDAERRPIAGAWVSLRERDDESSSPHWIGRTGADGLARLPHAAAVLAEFDEPLPLALGLAHPGAQLVEHALDPAALPSEPIELVMPATCTLVVQWVDERGAALDIRGSIDASPADDQGGRAIARLRTFEEEGYDSFAVEHGRLELACAPTGRRLQLRSYPIDGWDVADDEPEAAVALPSRAGERVEARVVLARKRRVLSGVARRADGTPLADTELALHFEHAGAQRAAGARWRAELCDATGRFEFSVDFAFSATGLEFEARPRGEPTLRARAALPPIPAGGRHDFGALVFEPADVLAAGVVVDAQGAPVAGARVAIEVYDAGMTVHGDVARARGRAVRELRCGDDGRFELRGTASSFAPYATLQMPRFEPTRFGHTVLRSAALLVASAPDGDAGLGSSSAPLPLGRDDVELVLPIAARLRGRIEPPLGRSPSEFVVVARWPAGSGADAQRVEECAPSTARAHFGAFDFGALQPGTWTVELATRDTEVVLARVDGVVVAPGVAPDPRLAPLRASGDWRRLVIELVDAEQRPVRGGGVAVLDPSRGADAWSSRASWPCGPGRFAVWTERVPIDVEAWCDGARPTRARGVDRDTRVVLEPGLRVELRFPNLQAGTPVEVSCWPDAPQREDDARDEHERAHARIDWGGELDGRLSGVAPGPLVLLAPGPGRWRIEATARDGEAPRALRDARGETEWIVEVGADGAVVDLVDAPAKSEPTPAAK